MVRSDCYRLEQSESKLSSGSYQFPFALKLQLSGLLLLLSFEGTVGHIHALIVKAVMRVQVQK